MATFSKTAFSPATTGLGILVTGTVSASANTIHATSSSTTFDEIWLYATNNNASAVDLTIEFGETTATKVIKQSIPAVSGLTIVIPGLVLGPSKTITAFASSANVVTVLGYVNRIS